jgi:hypothetical protein
LVDLPKGMPKEIFSDLAKARVCGQALLISVAGKGGERGAAADSRRDRVSLPGKSFGNKRPGGKPAAKSAGKFGGKPGGKPGGKFAGKPSGKSSGKSGAKLGFKTGGKPGGNPGGKHHGKPSAK